MLFGLAPYLDLHGGISLISCKICVYTFYFSSYIRDVETGWTEGQSGGNLRSAGYSLLKETTMNRHEQARSRDFYFSVNIVRVTLII
jgi:hypothetical protein